MPPTRPGRGTTRALLVLWLLLFLAAGLLSLGTYPPVNYNLGDETGLFFMSIDYVDGSLRESPVNPKGYFGLQGLFLKVFGQTIQAGRAFSLLAATATLFLTYLLGRQAAGPGAGLLASVLLGTSYAFSWHARIIRHEMLSAAVVVAAVLFLVHAYQARRDWPAFVAGLTAALSVTVHPNNLQYVVAMVPVYLVLYRDRAWSFAAVSFVMGLAAGLALWYVTTYLPAIPKAAQQAGVAAAVAEAGGVVKAIPFPVLEKGFFAVTAEALRSLPVDYADYVRRFDDFFPNKIMMAAVAGGWALVWVAGLFGDYRFEVLGLLGFTLLVSLVNYYVAPKYGFWHMVEFYPFYAVAAALGIWGVYERIGGRAGALVAGLIALVLVAAGVADTAQGYAKFRHYSYPRLLSKVSKGIEGRVLAMDLYSPAFSRGQFVGPWFQLDRKFQNCPLVSQKIKEIGVQYIVADDLLLRFSGLSCGKQYERNLRQYLDRHATLVRVVDERYPSYWAGGDMIQRIVVLRAPR